MREIHTPAEAIEEALRVGEGRSVGDGALAVETGGTDRRSKRGVLCTTLRRDSKRFISTEHFDLLYSAAREEAPGYLVELRLPGRENWAPTCDVDLAWHALFLMNAYEYERYTPSHPAPVRWTLVSRSRMSASLREMVGRVGLEDPVIAVCPASRRAVCLGTAYAGELLNCLFVGIGHDCYVTGGVALHAASFVLDGGCIALVGYSGAGKTTLSWLSGRPLADDQLALHPDSVSALHKAVYATASDLGSPTARLVRSYSVRFGAILQDVVVEPTIDFSDTRISENSCTQFSMLRCKDAVPGWQGTGNAVVIFLTNDPVGVFPALSWLVDDDLYAHFRSGISLLPRRARFGVAADALGSAPCYGPEFLSVNPREHADRARALITAFAEGGGAWLVNTGVLPGTEARQPVEDVARTVRFAARKRYPKDMVTTPNRALLLEECPLPWGRSRKHQRSPDLGLLAHVRSLLTNSVQGLDGGPAA